MDFGQALLKNKKSSPFLLEILNTIPKNQLKELTPSSTDVSLYIWTPKKVLLAAYKTPVAKSKLLSNLEIYEWRHQTQFPIIKTVFVHVNQSANMSSSTVDLTVYNQYCPLKMSQLYEISLAQSIFILKDTILGFERLFTRFGCFQISDSMIGINEKGSCRVWFNQNFGLNYFAKKDINEINMVNKIINIIQPRTQQSKSSKRLFSTLKACPNFYAAIKALQFFVKQTKTLVPTKYIMASSSTSTDISRLEAMHLNKQPLYEISSPTIAPRLSIKQYKLRQFFGDDLKANIKQRKNTSSSPMKLKRLKSQKDIKHIAKFMKISDLETAYTGRRNRIQNPDSNLESPQKPKEIHQIQSEHKINPRRIGWVQESSYLMGEQQTPIKQPQKRRKQLTQSQAIILESFPLNHSSERKYSCKIMGDKKHASPSKYGKVFNKKITNQSISKQLDEIWSQSPKQLVNKSNRIEEVDEDRFRQQVCGSVLKCNGWVAKVSGLLDIPSNLETSFQEGMQENLSHKDIKLEKLNNVGRQQMLMSILHQN